MRRTIACPKISLPLLSGFLPVVSLRFRVRSPPSTLVASPVLLPAFFLAASSLPLFQPGMRKKTDAADLAPLSVSCSTPCNFAHQPRTLSVDPLRTYKSASSRDDHIKTPKSEPPKMINTGPGPRYPGDFGPERRCRFHNMSITRHQILCRAMMHMPGPPAFCSTLPVASI